ncbi:hypothetical protein Pla52o_16210 [Novipirellula galeiformis]|uniref:Uncharacterized protein n=2 Tax=Novipirellula galeiformis TaxID=2528004 RepID=A0A5C6CLV6_9BACT|nr:hypothetical protein Pla52o_16210 [Novipirellula galeiformis]
MEWFSKLRMKTEMGTFPYNNSFRLKSFSSVRPLTTQIGVPDQNAVRSTYGERFGFPRLLDEETPSMKFAKKCFASVVFVFLVSTVCGDAQAQSGSRRGGYTAPTMPAAAAPRIAPAPMQSYAPQQAAAVPLAPIGIGSGCASGNCGGGIPASPTLNYSSSMAYQSYAPVYQSPTQYHQTRHYASPPTCSNGHCRPRRQIFRHR